MTGVDRPRGMTLLCLLLGWLSFAGFANSVVIGSGQMLPIVPAWIGLLAFAYGVTASVATYKLWRMDGSGLVWFRAWAVVVVLATAAITPIFHELAMVGIGQLLFLAFITVVVIWPLDRYVHRKLAS